MCVQNFTSELAFSRRRAEQALLRAGSSETLMKVNPLKCLTLIACQRSSWVFRGGDLCVFSQSRQINRNLAGLKRRIGFVALGARNRIVFSWEALCLVPESSTRSSA
jgi:hypothetical protein